MLLTEVVQHPIAHLFRLRHREGGDADRVKGRTEPLFRLDPQGGRSAGGLLLRSLCLPHTITPALAFVKSAESCGGVPGKARKRRRILETLYFNNVSGLPLQLCKAVQHRCQLLPGDGLGEHQVPRLVALQKAVFHGLFRVKLL